MSQKEAGGAEAPHHPTLWGTQYLGKGVVILEGHDISTGAKGTEEGLFADHWFGGDSIAGLHVAPVQFGIQIVAELLVQVGDCGDVLTPIPKSAASPQSPNHHPKHRSASLGRQTC